MLRGSGFTAGRAFRTQDLETEGLSVLWLTELRDIVEFGIQVYRIPLLLSSRKAGPKKVQTFCPRPNMQSQRAVKVLPLAE